MKKFDAVVIGAGLAGSEAALTLANCGQKILVYEQKPKNFSPAHISPHYAELVCSNSLKSLEISSAHGLLKEELRLLGSPLLEYAMEARVPGGKALVVDREAFGKRVTTALQNHSKIEVRSESISSVDLESLNEVPSLIATGPLTAPALSDWILKLCGDEGLYFYDATSAVVSLDSLDLDYFFWGNRNQDGDDYLNLPLTREQYHRFRAEVLSADKVESHLPGEELCFFEGCLPIEELARRGEETLAFSCMKPIGLFERVKSPKWPAGERVHAVIQFRREKAAGELLSMVGFQSRMKWPEQERVFRNLPGMTNAQFVRLGAMHRNTFLNTPLHLNDRLEMKQHPNLFFAGQITGSEGYSEAIASGHYAALQILKAPPLPENTGIRSLIRYLIQSNPQHFQPMNFNFGLLPPMPETSVKMKRGSKVLRNQVRAERAIEELKAWLNKNSVFYSSNTSAKKVSSESLAPTLIEPESQISIA